MCTSAYVGICFLFSLPNVYECNGHVWEFHLFHPHQCWTKSVLILAIIMVYGIIMLNILSCAYLSFFLFSSPLTLFLALYLHLLLFFCTWNTILVPAITVLSVWNSQSKAFHDCFLSFRNLLECEVFPTCFKLISLYPQSLYSIDSQHLWKSWYYFIYL